MRLLQVPLLLVTVGMLASCGDGDEMRTNAGDPAPSAAAKCEGSGDPDSSGQGGQRIVGVPMYRPADAGDPPDPAHERSPEECAATAPVVGLYKATNPSACVDLVTPEVTDECKEFVQANAGADVPDYIDGVGCIDLDDNEDGDCEAAGRVGYVTVYFDDEGGSQQWTVAKESSGRWLVTTGDDFGD